MADDIRDLLGGWRPDEGDEGPENENLQPRPLREKKVEVLGLWRAAPGGDDTRLTESVLLLRDSRGRRLPIEIGAFETMAIHYALQGTPSERPLTHELTRLLVEQLGGTIERVVIDDVWEKTFYAKVEIAAPGGKSALSIDSRPSDAIALALRADAPIYVAEDVLVSSAHDEGGGSDDD